MTKSIITLLFRMLFRVHITIYRLTRGRVLGRIKGAPVLLLTTTGRKSGKPRSLPLLYLSEEDNYFVVASNGGSVNHPAWYLNLRDNPIGTIQIGSSEFKIRAATTDPEERERLWLKAVEMFSGYDTYQKSILKNVVNI